MEVQEVKESNFFYPRGWGSSYISVCLMSIYIHSLMLIFLRTKCVSCLSSANHQNSAAALFYNQAIHHSWKRILFPTGVICQRGLWLCFLRYNEIHTSVIRFWYDNCSCILDHMYFLYVLGTIMFLFKQGSIYIYKLFVLCILKISNNW